MNICMSVFQIAASYISTLLRHRDYVMRIEERESRDQLTGLLGIGSFRKMLEPILRGVKDGTDHKKWTVIFFNITGFRTYNLARGHAMGDELLRPPPASSARSWGQISPPASARIISTLRSAEFTLTRR